MSCTAALLRSTDRFGDQHSGVDLVLAASWCCSVGMTWTVELRAVSDPMVTPVLAGPVVDWICSGVPTDQPLPDEITADVLAERGFWLFTDDPEDFAVRSRSRQPIGYVTREPDVLRLAVALADVIPGAPVHPMVLAARWIEAGYSVDAAVGWSRAGIGSPDAAQALLSTEMVAAEIDPAELLADGSATARSDHPIG